MRRYVSNLQVSGKLRLTPFVVIPFLLALIIAAYLGMSHQRDIVSEIFLKRFKGYENSTKVLGDMTSVHVAVLRALRHSGALPESGKLVKLGKEQAASVHRVVLFMEESVRSGSLREEGKAAYEAALKEAKAYEKLLSGLADSKVTGTDTAERVASAADERFEALIKKLQALQAFESGQGRESYERSLRTFNATWRIIVVLFIAAVLLSVSINIFILRSTIIAPIRSIESAARKVAEGDLSFDVDIGSGDEIGRVSRLLKDSFSSLEGVLQRINELSDRILKVVEEVESEAEKVIKGAEAETEATNSISSSVEELNATAAGVADNTESLAASAGDASASIEQMVSSIKSINGSIRELNDIVESTSASIEQLSAVIREVAVNADDLAGASEETLSAISEITAAIKEVDTSAQESAKLSEKVSSDAANLGMASIRKTMDGMKEIETSVRNTAECVDMLGKRSKEIEMILSVIEGVNDETELLSLNAAILAAQAGEHGKGFSVVADEIKALSRRTEKSTKDIASLIEAVQHEIGNAASAMRTGINSVELGLSLARDAEAALRKVLDSSTKSSEMTLSIKRSTEEQARAANLVSAATERIRNMIGHVAKATAEQSQGIMLVMKASEKMKELSRQVSMATDEQALSSKQIAQATETVFERSQQISKSLAEHKKGSQNIVNSIEAVKEIPVENEKLALRISKTLWNLQKDAELLKAEMERFRFSGKRGHSLQFGVVPLKEPSEMFRKFTPLSEYLSRRIGLKVDLRVAIDMESAVDDVGKNVTQLCAMGPANYVEARTRFGVRVIAKALRLGKPYHRAAIVVKTDSRIRSVRDLKGKSFAFVSPKSATGHIAPLATLREADMTVGDLKHYRFLGSHERVVKAVLDGEFDSGGMMEETAVQYAEKGLRILQFSPEVPEFNICCNPSVDEETMKSIRDALTSLDVSKGDDAIILKSLGKDCTGFVPASENDYNIFKEKMMGLEVEMSADGYHRGKLGARSSG